MSIPSGAGQGLSLHEMQQLLCHNQIRGIGLATGASAPRSRLTRWEAAKDSITPTTSALKWVTIVIATIAFGEAAKAFLLTICPHFTANNYPGHHYFGNLPCVFFSTPDQWQATTT